MTDLDLDRLRALCDAATTGPWHADHMNVIGTVAGWWSPIRYDAHRVDHDAAFIAAARTAVPDLLDRLTAAEEEAERTLEYVRNADRRVIEADQRTDAAREEAERLRRAYNGGASRQVHEGLRADLAAAREEAERLRRWKAEASIVLGQWEAVWEALGRPGALGDVKSAGAMLAVAELTAARDALARFRAALTDPAAVEAVHNAVWPWYAPDYVHEPGAISHLWSSRDRAAAALRAFAAFMDAPTNPEETS